MKRLQAGYTLIEITIGLAISAIVFGVGGMTLKTGVGIFEQSVANTVINDKASRILNRIAKELAGAGASMVSPRSVAPFSSDSLRFQKVTGWNGSDPTWSDEISILLEMEPAESDNGLDDDGDGLIDECQVVLVRRPGQSDEERAVIGKGIREFLEGEVLDGNDNNGNGLDDERGLCFSAEGNMLMIRLSVQNGDPMQRVVTRTLEAGVGLRNE